MSNTLRISKIPEKILRKKLKAIDAVTPEIKAFIADMKETLFAAHGIGLAANQVGEDLALFIIDAELAKEYRVPEVFINPEIAPYSKNGLAAEEGCLSIPESWLIVTRAKKVKFKAFDDKGKKFKGIAKGLLARVLQHEYDHLQGLLIIDRVKTSEKLKTKSEK